jgi:hypothetical protein
VNEHYDISIKNNLVFEGILIRDLKEEEYIPKTRGDKVAASEFRMIRALSSRCPEMNRIYCPRSIQLMSRS